MSIILAGHRTITGLSTKKARSSHKSHANWKFIFIIVRQCANDEQKDKQKNYQKFENLKAYGEVCSTVLNRLWAVCSLLVDQPK